MPRREGEVLRLGTAIVGNSESARRKPRGKTKARLIHANPRARRKPLQAAPRVSNVAIAIASRGPRSAHSTNWNAW